MAGDVDVFQRIRPAIQRRLERGRERRRVVRTARRDVGLIALIVTPFVLIRRPCIPLPAISHSNTVSSPPGVAQTNASPKR